MVTARLSIPIALLVLALGGAPTISAATEPEADFVSVNPRGSAPVERDGDAFVWSTDLFSLTTLEKIGSFTDRATCATRTPPPCIVYDMTTTYRVPGGDVVSHGQWSAGPDPSQPGVYFIGSRPHSDTLVAGTGRFQGRTGRVSGWGLLDLRRFPDRIGVDVRAFIRFAPNDAHVLGSRELVVPHEPPGADRFQTELFLSEGANQSKDPARFVLNTPLLSLSDRSHIGTVTDSFTCAVSPPPCPVMELTPVLQYPDGTITIRTEVPMAPDPVRQGFFLFGSRPTENNVVSATGAYAGRTGQLSVSGTVDMRRAPSTVPYEGVGVLVFDD